ncbi:MAG: PKD domain-containing protein [Ignavibacteria bacterium]|nr:PKD domain-containing protein [Ignavibacteria bacterium]
MKFSTVFLAIVAISLLTISSAIAQLDYLCGDVNNDGKVDVADLNYLVNNLKFGGPPPVDLSKADFNVSATVDTGDVEYLTNYLFYGGPAPLCYTSFMPTSDTTLPTGTYWFYDFIIPPGVTVQYQDSVTLNILHSFTIDVGGTLKGNCIPIIINHLSQVAPLKILGKLIDSCTSSGTMALAASAGRVVIQSVGTMMFGGNSMQPQGQIATSGPLFIGDPWYSPTTAQDTVTYVASGVDSGEVPPVCNLKSTYTGTNTVSLSWVYDASGEVQPQTILYFGDGDSSVNPVSPVVHAYVDGIYQAILKVSDGVNNSQASLSLNVPSKVIQAYVTPFQKDSLVKQPGALFQFNSQAPAGYSLLWDFGDGDTSTSASVQHAFEDAGEHSVFLIADSGGTIYSSHLNVYVTIEGGETTIEYPSPPENNFPMIASIVRPDRRQHGDFSKDREQEDHPGTCGECSFCAPGWVPPPGAFLGAGYVAFGNFDWAHVGPFTFGSYNTTIVITGALPPGAPAVGFHPVSLRGRDGASNVFATLYGTIVVCTTSVTLGNGSNGGNHGPNGGCPGYAKGGRGGNAGSLGLLAPNGRIAFCGEITISVANGGNGGNASANGVGIIPPCIGCGAIAKGGHGGQGGGGIVYLGETVCFDAGYRVTFTGAAVGGNGGNATATGAPGITCPGCPGFGGPGGFAEAYAGRRGSCGVWFATRSDKTPSADVVLHQILRHMRFLHSCTPGLKGIATATGGAGGPGGAPWQGIPIGGDGGAGGNAKVRDGRKGQGGATPGIGGPGGPAPIPGKQGPGGISYSLAPEGFQYYFGPDGGPGQEIPPYVSLTQIPDSQFCNVPPCTFGLTLFGGPSLDDSSYGHVSTRVVDQAEFAQLSGDHASVPQYFKDNNGVRVFPGGMVIVLDENLQGGIVDGIQTTLTAFAGPGSVHVEGFSGGNRVLQTVNNDPNQRVTMSIRYNGPGKLDSIVVWGYQFMLDLWGTRLTYKQQSSSQSEVQLGVINPSRKEK